MDRRDLWTIKSVHIFELECRDPRTADSDRILKFGNRDLWTAKHRT